jgi:coenzyme F420-0:L-glutamate ligase / coenzyme F420-1:gamma-L-glutamate ligase
MTRYEVIGVGGIPEVRPGDDLVALILGAASRQGTPVAAEDLLVIGQKIVSKAEGRLLRLSDVTPSEIARSLAAGHGRDPRLVEVILRESRRVVRMDRGVLITETHHGWVCANAGVDQSNVDVDTVALLPADPDRSARDLREGIRVRSGLDVAVIIADTFGRPWREGLTNVAIGLAGFAPLRSYLGELDSAGRPLQATIIALADELAGAAEPVMGKLDRIPVAIVRGLSLAAGEEGSKGLLRDPARDLFR